MSRIGVFGGTFDPIHNGHLILAETAFDAAGLDKVMLIPSGCSYFKADQKVTRPEMRLEMTKLAAAGNDHFQVLDMEVKRSGNSYTVETLKELHRTFPEDELCYIVGADTLVMMSMWKDPQRIFDLAEILVETRSDEVTVKGLEDEIYKIREAFHVRLTMLPVRNIEISSTDIRNRVREGRSVKYLVPDPVLDYIREQGLYRD